MAEPFISGQSTARKAAAILVAKDAEFWIPTEKNEEEAIRKAVVRGS